MEMAAPSPAPSPRVRVEDASTSIGRSYTSSNTWDGKAVSVPGLGAQRRALTTRSFVPDAPPTLSALTMASVNLRTASRADVLAYFENTWALTDTLFSALRSDAVFYAVPDKLRRPLIFYFGHPAALYINKLHQAGIVGARGRGGKGGGRPRARRRRRRARGACAVGAARIFNPAAPHPRPRPSRAGRPRAPLLPEAL